MTMNTTPTVTGDSTATHGLTISSTTKTTAPTIASNPAHSSLMIGNGSP